VTTAAPRRHPELLVIVAATVLLRLPVVLSRAPLTYDDGVYLASAGALRAGGLPFRDVFSSQGPAFLPMLWIADAVGLRTLWSPRLLPLAAGIVLVVVVHRLGLRVADRWGAALAALLVAISGLVLFTTQRVESDGVTAAIAAAAVLVASRPPTRRRTIATALLLGLALAVKSLFAGPAALAVVWLVARAGGWRRAAAVVAGAVATVVVLAVPWGISTVWDQYVGLHLLVREDLDPARNLRFVRRTVHGYDRILELLAVAALVTAVCRRVARRPRPERPDRDLAIALWLWCATSLLVLAFHAPLFFQHLTVLVPSAALLVARYRPPLAVVAVILLLLVPAHAERAGWRRTRPATTASEAAAIDVLQRVQPRDAEVISDEPALGWLAERTSPGSMVDLSHVRIDAGDLTTADVAAAAEEPGVCAVLLWSGRLEQLPGLHAALPDYDSVLLDGGHELLLRAGCALAARAAP
jgi:hypothetical protein